MSETATRDRSDAAQHLRQVPVYGAEEEQQAHRFGTRLNENIRKFQTTHQHAEIKYFRLKFLKGAWNAKAEFSAQVELDIGMGFRTALQITSKAESKEMFILCIAPVEMRNAAGVDYVLSFADQYIRDNLPTVKKLIHYRDWVIR